MTHQVRQTALVPAAKRHRNTAWGLGPRPTATKNISVSREAAQDRSRSIRQTPLVVFESMVVETLTQLLLKYPSAGDVAVGCEQISRLLRRFAARNEINGG